MNTTVDKIGRDNTQMFKRFSLHSREEVRAEYMQDAAKGVKNANTKINLLDEVTRVHKDTLKKKNEWLAVNRIIDLKEYIGLMLGVPNNFGKGKILDWDAIKENEDIFKYDVTKYELVEGSKRDEFLLRYESPYMMDMLDLNESKNFL